LPAYRGGAAPIHLPKLKRIVAALICRKAAAIWMSRESSMEYAWGIIAIIGVIVGGLLMVFGFRKTQQQPAGFAQVDGFMKQDWTRTGNIDFHAAALESTSRSRSRCGSKKRE